MNRKIISSGLNADSFGKTRMSNLMNQSGLLAKINSFEEKIEFSEWKFTGTEIDENDIAWFSGEIFDNARTIQEIFSKPELDEKDKESIIAVEKVLSKVIDLKKEDSKEIGDIGGGGIFINEDNTEILFIPSDSFEQATRNVDDREGKTYAERQGFYIYKGLSGIDQTLFTRASIAYRALTGRFAYSKNDMSERQTDILDRLFTPTAYVLNGIDTELSDSIDAGLSIPMKFEPLPGERRYKNEKADKIRSELLKLSKTFKIESFEKELFNTNRKEELPKKKFDDRTKKFMESKEKKTKLSRFYRRNKARIYTTIAIMIFAIWGVNSFVETNGTRATTQGLDSIQSVQLFYSLTHRANSVDLDEICKGKELDDFNQIITSFYVTSKERESYNASDRTVQPEEWMFYKTTSNYWIFGLTNLMIDGKPLKLSCEVPKKNEKRQPIFEENGVALKQGDTKTFTAEYYLVNTESARINIDKIAEKITLFWNGKRWYVINLEPIEGKAKTTTIKTKVFTEEYQKTLDENGGSVKKATEILRKKYPWIPTDFDLESGAKTLFDIYHSTSAEQFLME